MPDLPKADGKLDVIGVFCSDIHLSHRPPLLRQAEPSWYGAMERPLREVSMLADHYGCPLVIAGDLFDRPDNTAELVNFALDAFLPASTYAIPGQHDLMHHRYIDRQKTSYWTMVASGRIVDLNQKEDDGRGAGRMNLCGFPWGATPAPPTKKHSLCINVAVLHAYVWAPGKGGYPGAPDAQRLRERAKGLACYDAACFGDNHDFFIAPKERIVNCGTFMRRKQDERGCEPSVGLLLSNGEWRRHRLDTSQDIYTDPEKMRAEVTIEVGRANAFLAGLAKIHPENFDFVTAVLHWMEQQTISDEARQVVLKCLGT